MIPLLEKILQTAAEIGSDCGPLGITAFGIIAVVVILGFVLYLGMKDAPPLLRVIVGVALVAGLLFILVKGMISPGLQSDSGALKVPRLLYKEDLNFSRFLKPSASRPNPTVQPEIDDQQRRILNDVLGPLAGKINSGRLQSELGNRADFNAK